MEPPDTGLTAPSPGPLQERVPDALSMTLGVHGHDVDLARGFPITLQREEADQFIVDLGHESRWAAERLDVSLVCVGDAEPLWKHFKQIGAAWDVLPNQVANSNLHINPVGLPSGLAAEPPCGERSETVRSAPVARWAASSHQWLPDLFCHCSARCRANQLEDELVLR
jgi:hypothetical protein